MEVREREQVAPRRQINHHVKLAKPKRPVAKHRPEKSSRQRLDSNVMTRIAGLVNVLRNSNLVSFCHAIDVDLL